MAALQHFLLLSALAFALWSQVAVGETHASLAARTFSESALLGMQLSVQDGFAAGKVPAKIASCVARAKADSFHATYDEILSREFSPDEIRDTDMFLATVVGKKYARHGVLQLCTGTGHQAPEALPQFSDAEMAELVGFSKTSAGQKLLVAKALQSPSASNSLNTRIQALLAECDSTTR